MWPGILAPPPGMRPQTRRTSQPFPRWGVFSIDVLAYNSKINGWNPGFKVGFSLLLLLICVIANNLYVS
ncbi:hypothetical protein NE464_22475, partial [Eubacterium callanderi]|nr:hypothetical protein [Eubacterium callanderi]